MIRYTHENGYANIDLKEAKEAIDTLKSGSMDKVTLLCLLYEYECLLRVIDGKACFGHSDGSETRRVKIWS